MMLSAGLLVHGAHVATVDELTFSRATIRVAGLREWLCTPHNRDGELLLGLGGQEATAERQVALRGASITFSAEVRQSRGDHETCWKRHAWVSFELEEPLTYREWIERWITPLVHLVAFATREPSRIESFVAVTDSSKTPASEDWQREAVEFVSPHTSLLQPPSVEYRRLLASFAALGDRVEAFVARWWKVYRQLGGAAGFLVSALSSRMYLEGQLVNYTSVAEAYHRVFVVGQAPGSLQDHERLVARMLAALDDDEQRARYEDPLSQPPGATQRRRILELIRRAGEVVPGRSCRRWASARGTWRTRLRPRAITSSTCRQRSPMTSCAAPVSPPPLTCW